MEERLLAKDNFEMPKVLKDNEAAVVNIIRLIIADPGTYPLHPEMGVGLYSKFRTGWSDEVVISLRSEIQNQIQTYMRELSGVSVNVVSRGHNLFITIQFNDTMVNLMANVDNKTITIEELEGEN